MVFYSFVYVWQYLKTIRPASCSTQLYEAGRSFYWEEIILSPECNEPYEHLPSPRNHPHKKMEHYD